MEEVSTGPSSRYVAQRHFLFEWDWDWEEVRRHSRDGKLAHYIL